LAIGTGYAVARRTAIYETNPRFILTRSARSMGPWFLCFVPILAAVGPISDFLHLPSRLPVVLALGTVLTMLTGQLAMGVLIGCRRFQLVAALNIGTALTRVLLGLALPKFFDVTDGSLLATLL